MADTLNFCSKLTFPRLVNLLRLLISYYISRVFRKAWLSGKPASIAVEPTTSCNLRCPQCISGLRAFTRPTGMIDLELFKSIIDRQKKHLMSLILYFQGEPLLHPDFFTLVQIASKARIYTLTSSNGHFFNELNSLRLIEAGLDRLIISVDSFDQEVYSRYRVGGNIEKVKEGIKILLQLRKKTGQKKPVIILQFLVFRDNEKRLNELKRKGYEMGADRVVFKSMQMYDQEGLQQFIPEMNKYSRYRMNQEGNFEIKNHFYNHCWKMWHSSVITWDGKVLPCCFDKDGQHSLGQIHNGNRFENIWVSDPYQRFRNRILHERKTIDICRNCSEGTKIWI